MRQLRIDRKNSHFINSHDRDGKLIKKFYTKILGIWRGFKELFDFVRIQGQSYSFDISLQKIHYYRLI